MHTPMPLLPRTPNVAVVGATGAVGREMLRVLEDRAFPIGRLRLFASARSAGADLPFCGTRVPVVALPAEPDRAVFEDTDLVLLAVSADLSRTLVPLARSAGAVVVDNSSAFRQDPACPLVIPEVNGAVLDALAGPAIIANPNCSTIIALVAVTPIHRAAGIERMVVSTYQAVSGAGAEAMAELESQARDFAAGRAITPQVFRTQCLFNVFSHDSTIGPDGLNEEERKLLLETRRIWDDPAVRIAATCVRVPVLRAHSEAINLTLRRPMLADEARDLLARSPGVRVVDDRAQNRFPEPIHASGADDVLVGRVREDRSQPHGLGLDLFVSGDQLRKGAALNAVQIAEWLAAGGQAAGDQDAGGTEAATTAATPPSARRAAAR